MSNTKQSRRTRRHRHRHGVRTHARQVVPTLADDLLAYGDELDWQHDHTRSAETRTVIRDMIRRLLCIYWDHGIDFVVHAAAKRASAQERHRHNPSTMPTPRNRRAVACDELDVPY